MANEAVGPASVPIDSALVSPSPLRLWPAWLIGAAQPVVLVLNVTPSIHIDTRLAFMVLGPLVSALLISTWVMIASGLRRWEKSALAAAGIVCPVVSLLVSLPEDALRATLWIYGVPLAVIMVTVGLSVRSRSPRRSILAIGLLGIGWGSFAFLRNEGFEGDYFPQFAWRWSPRHEDTLPALENPAGPAPASAADAPADSLSWPQFRGPAGNASVSDEITPQDWAAKPPKELWRIPVGPGWSSFSHDKGRLFTQEQRREDECITCYSALDGRLIWSHADETRFSEVVSGAGPRSTPSVADGCVYALGGRGLLTCLNDADGTVVWQRNLVRELKAPVPTWGFSGSPLILGDKLVVFAGAPGNEGLIALDRLTGRILWGFPSTDTNYTTARPMTFANEECVVFCDGRGVHALAPDTGSPRWTYKPKLWNGPPLIDPQQLSQSSLLVGLGEAVGLTRLEVGKSGGTWSVEESWTTTRLRSSFNDMVVLDDCVYGFNQSVFVCFDAKTGERKWQGGRYGFGQAVLLRNPAQIIVTAENGDAVLLRATPERLDEIARIPVLHDKTWNHPIVVGDRLFLRNGKTAVCLQLNP